MHPQPAPVFPLPLDDLPRLPMSRYKREFRQHARRGVTLALTVCGVVKAVSMPPTDEIREALWALGIDPVTPSSPTHTSHYCHEGATP